MSAELIAKLDAVEKMIDTFTVKSKEEIKQVGDMSQETKTALDNLTAQFGEVQKELAKQALALEEEQKKAQRFAGHGEKVKSFSEHLNESLATESAKSMLDRRFGEIEVKATMLPTSPFFGAGVIEPQRLQGVVYTPPNDRVRPHLTVLPASSDRVAWVQETAFNNRADTVTPGNDKPESDLNLSPLDVPIQTIAHTFRMHKNILADVSMFASYVAQRGVDGLQDKEDEQVLYGNGVSPNLVGILTDGLSVFNPASMYAALVSDGSRGAGYYDILRFAILQVRNAKLRPTAIFLNPADKAAIDVAQVSTGSYRRQPDGTVLVNNIWGVPVVEVDAMNPGEFAVGAFRQATYLFDREAINVNWFEQDRDNVVKNLVTVRIEERIAAATQRPEGIVTGKFDDYMGKYSS